MQEAARSVDNLRRPPDTSDVSQVTRGLPSVHLVNNFDILNGEPAFMKKCPPAIGFCQAIIENYN
jgi:hypothetical protein